MSAVREVRVPDIGDASDVAVLEVLVSPGDRVVADAPMIVLESEKAALEVPSPVSGVVREVLVAVGDRVSAGSLVLALSDAEAAPAASPIVAPRPADPREAEPAPPVAAAADVELPRASPAVRRLARHLGVDLRAVRPTAPGMRTTREDLERFVADAMQQRGRAPDPSEGTPFGPIERKRLSRTRKAAAENLTRSWTTIPHVTSFGEADVSDLELFREQINRERAGKGPKLTMLALAIKACTHALQSHPELNSSLDGDTLLLKRYVHVGFAVDTPEGLVVPVIRDADRKSLSQLAMDTAALAASARAGKLRPADLKGGSFTISSLGGIGGTYFTPIINPPEVSILGLGRVQQRLALVGDKVVTRQILPLSLSWDHRVIDGAAAARFLTQLAEILADYRRSAL